MKYASAIVLVWIAAAAVLFVACHDVTILNDDPLHGGPCGNGDQLAHLCADKVTCCPNGFLCATDKHGCEPDPNAVGPDMVAGAKRDAGRD